MASDTGTFVGGPWDGEVRAIPKKDRQIKVAMIGRINVGSPDTAMSIQTGIYELAHTNVGEPLRYEWGEPR